MTVIRAKVLPPRLVRGIVERPSLLTRLDAIWSKPLGLIVAPAGFGKSTLACAWSATSSQRVGWLTLDESDNDLDRFIFYMLEAIASIDSSLVANTRALFERSSQPSALDLAETLADELVEVDDDLCIIIDEAEHLASPAAWEFIECLVRLAPPRFHLLLISRIDPPLPLARLRMREQIAELRGGDLLFRPDDIKCLLTQRGIVLEDDVIAAFVDATHGWPAGIRLALMQSENPVEEWRISALASQAHSEFVLDSLAGELIDRLPADIGETLLAASIVDDLNPDLLEALVGRDVRARTLIEEYTRAGVLIDSAPRGGSWVRLHPLYRDLFRRQLTTRRTRRDITRLHRVAARWFIAERDVRNAVHHLIAARDVEDLIHLLNEEIPLAIDREDWAAVSEWLDEIPEEIIAKSPTLALGNCWVMFFKGNWLAMRAARDELRMLLDALPADVAQKAQWMAELAVLDSTEIGSFLTDTSRTLAIVERASPQLAPNQRFVRGHVSLQRAMALEELGRSDDADAVIEEAVGRGSGRVDSAVIRPLVAHCFVLRQRGDFARLETASGDLALLAAAHDLPVSKGWAQLFYGLVMLLRNDLERAEIAFSDLAGNHRHVHIACLREGMLMLARVYWALGDRPEADAVLRRLREILVNQGSVEMLSSVTSLERFLTYLDDPTVATSDWNPISIVDTTPHAFHHPVTTAVLINSASGVDRAAHALLMADTFSSRIRTAHFRYWEPETLALQAIALSALQREDEAIAHMREALAHDLTRHMTRTFLDLGSRSRALYQVLADDAEVGLVARSFLGYAHTSSLEGVARSTEAIRLSLSGGMTRRTMLSLLTDRELMVLELLDQRLSYKEIGNDLSISPLTVKRHAGNIYDKLGATSRREAVEHARELGWRPGPDRH